jgi:hypothetical protein
MWIGYATQHLDAARDFVVEYSCVPDATLVRKELPAEAGFKSQLQLNCLPGATR